MAYPVSTGGSDQWQTSDGNKHDSMGAAQIAQDNIDSGKNMSFTNQQSTSGPKSLFDDPAYLDKHRKDMEALRGLGNEVVKSQSRKLDSILDKYYRTVQKLHIEGNDFFRKGNWSGTVEALGKALDIYTSSQFEQFKKELFDHARHVNEYWNNNSSRIEKLEDCPEYGFAETAIKTWQNDMERCKEWLETAKENSKLFSKSDELCSQGNIFREMGNLDKAISCYTQAISLSDDWGAYCARGRCYEKLWNIDQAIADFNSAIDSAVKKFGELSKGDGIYIELYGNRDRLIEKAEQIKPIEKKIASLSKANDTDGAWVEIEKWNKVTGRQMTKEDLARIMEAQTASSSSSPSAKDNLANAEQAKANAASSSSSPSAEELVAQGRTAYSNKDYAKAVELYRMAAEKGDKDAQNYLAFCYHDGKGVTEDEAKAIEWWKKSASMGNETARRYLTKNGIKW